MRSYRRLSGSINLHRTGKQVKISVIDIGSNSVRLLMWADGKSLYKKMLTTRLGEGLDASGRLLEQAAERTADAVCKFVEQARADGAENIYAFGTAAVRSASNPQILTDRIYSLCGVKVDIVSGEREARLGILGALGNGDGGIIDVGGASTEISVREGGKTRFSVSLPVGTVRIFDNAGRDLDRINAFIESRICGKLPASFAATRFYAIGGTASRLGGIKNGLTQYDSAVIHGTMLSLTEVDSYSRVLTRLSVEEIQRTTLCGRSSEVVGGGAALLAAVMRALGIAEVCVSESDNLEGYICERLANAREK